LAGEVRVRRRSGAPHAAAGPARELPRGIRRPVDDSGDLVERHPEHVVQHEGQALGRRQRVEHDEQRQADRVGEERLVLWIGFEVGADDGLRQPAADVVLTARTARAQEVEADAGHDRRQPRPQVVHRSRVRTAEL
jgi:hypothetical protein